MPEWVMDCCTVCVEVSRSVVDSSPPTSSSLGQIAHAAAGADELHSLSTAVADLIRIVAPTEPVQVPLHELVVLGSEGGDGFTASEEHSISLITGFQIRHARERWELSERHGATLVDWWPSVTRGHRSSSVFGKACVVMGWHGFEIRLIGKSHFMRSR